MTTLHYLVRRQCALQQRYDLLELVPIFHHPQLSEWLQTGRRLRQESAGDPLSYLVEAGGPPMLVSLEPEQLERRFEALRKQSRRCRDCPANRHPHPATRGEAYGCAGTVPLPITGEQEEGLLSMIEGLMENAAELEPTTTLPVRFIWDNGLDGEASRQLRERRDLFEREEPVEARIGPFLQKQALNTDQFLSLVFPPGKVQRAYLHLFHPFFQELLDEQTRSDEPTRESLLPLLRFFDALAIASELDVDVELVHIRSVDPEAAPASDPAIAAATDPLEGGELN